MKHFLDQVCIVKEFYYMIYLEEQHIYEKMLRSMFLSLTNARLYTLVNKQTVHGYDTIERFSYFLGTKKQVYTMASI